MRWFMGAVMLLLWSVVASADEPKSDVEVKAQMKQAVAHQEEEAMKLGKPVEITNSIGVKMRLIPAGEFMMGSSKSPEELVQLYDRPKPRMDFFRRELPQHRVRITTPFYLGATEVKQEQWDAVMGNRPWLFPSNDHRRDVKEGSDYPANCVTWDDAVRFCQRLSDKEHVQYRLPTEAEWEYACRAGTRTVYSFGKDPSELGRYAWFRDNARAAHEDYAHKVGQKEPNAFGLYDMHGNLCEWCSDWYDPHYHADSLTEDPPGPSAGSERVIRGGSWRSKDMECRSASRSRGRVSLSHELLGFRVVRAVTDESDQ